MSQTLIDFAIIEQLLTDPRLVGKFLDGDHGAELSWLRRTVADARNEAATPRLRLVPTDLGGHTREVTRRDVQASAATGHLEDPKAVTVIYEVLALLNLGVGGEGFLVGAVEDLLAARGFTHPVPLAER